MIGMLFNGKHSFRDFDLTLKDRSIGQPEKNKIKVSVPFMNGSYDFSLLNGDQTYTERTINYTFFIIEKDKARLYARYSSICNWLKGPNKDKLYDDNIKNYYFIGECLNVNLSEGYNVSEITVSFNTYPFLISEYIEGCDIWDIFNFELDLFQYTSFNISDSSEIEINNNGSTGINPIVICSSQMEILKDNRVYIFSAGETKSWDFKLNVGVNKLNIKGNGNIEFKWYKEIL